MEYKFDRNDDWFYVLSEEKNLKILERVTNYGWTPQKVQSIIDGIESAKSKPKGEEYIWGSEDIELYANENGVLLIDMMAQRARNDDPETSTLEMQHEELIKFLQDFKKFIEENS